MKNLVNCSLVLLFIPCSGNNNMTHTEPHKLLPDSEKAIKVEILDEVVDGEIAWVKHKTPMTEILEFLT